MGATSTAVSEINGSVVCLESSSGEIKSYLYSGLGGTRRVNVYTKVGALFGKKQGKHKKHTTAPDSLALIHSLRKLLPYREAFDSYFLFTALYKHPFCPRNLFILHSIGISLASAWFNVFKVLCTVELDLVSYLWNLFVLK